MGFEIIWTVQAINSFEKIVEYLDGNWTSKEVDVFVSKVNNVLEILRVFPRLFRQSERHPGLHRGIIVRQISLIYKIVPEENKIVLITFWDNRRNPASRKLA